MFGLEHMYVKYVLRFILVISEACKVLTWKTANKITGMTINWDQSNLVATNHSLRLWENTEPKMSKTIELNILTQLFYGTRKSILLIWKEVSLIRQNHLKIGMKEYNKLNKDFLLQDKLLDKTLRE